MRCRSLATALALLALATTHNCTCANERTAETKAAQKDAPAPNAPPDAAPRKGPTFVVVAGLDKVVDISTGYSHSCALTKEGKIFCWGKNDSGQIGDGTTVGKTSPTPVKLPFAAAKVAAGGDRTCAASAAGEIACWGKGVGKSGQSPVPAIVGKLEGLSDLASGFGFSCAIAKPPKPRGAKEQVYCFGENTHGELGKPARSKNLAQPKNAAAKPVAIAGTEGAVDVVASWGHACAVLKSGKLLCWGQSPGVNFDKKTARTPAARNPRAVDGIPEVKSVDTARTKTCVQAESGAVWCWGRGVLVENYAKAMHAPVEHAALKDAAEISIAAVHGCLRDDAGTVSCWGAFGPGGAVTEPTPIVGLGEVTAIDSGRQHTCVVRKDATVACFGQNQWGQLGNGDWGEYVSPY